MDVPRKPVPIVNDWARPFWEATRRNTLSIQRCEDCSNHIFYPRIACPHCGSANVEWVDASGKGKVYSYTVVESNSPSAFITDIPYVVAIIELAEGVRMLSNVVGCDPSTVRCDMPVEVVFEKLDDDFTLPKFKPAGS